jgi:sulfur carrier protein
MQTGIINIRVNGEPRQVPPNQSLARLLTFLEIAPERVAVELDKSIVRKRDWDKTTVEDGSQLEIVEFVGGG